MCSAAQVLCALIGNLLIASLSTKSGTPNNDSRKQAIMHTARDELCSTILDGDYYGMAYYSSEN